MLLNGDRITVLPAALTARRNWLVWRLVNVEGQPKPRKVPYYVNGAPRSGTQGSPEDVAALAMFDQAVQTLQASNGYYTGLGFAPQRNSGIVALDFDDCVLDGQIAPHVEELCEGTYTEFSPSGNGVRSFFAGTLQSRKDVKAARGPFPVEVFGHDGFVTVTGNVTPTCALFGWDADVAHLTPAVIAMYRIRGWDDSQAPGEFADNVLTALVPKVGVEAATIAEYLSRLPNDLDYDSWVKVGMAVHHETDGTGFALWDNWSKGSNKYTTEQYGRDRWESFGRYSSGCHITMAWAIKLANETQAHRRYAAAGQWKQRLSECNEEFQLREKLCPTIARDEQIGDMEREALAQTLYDRFRVLGTKYPIAQCRKLIAARRVEQDERTGWLGTDQWVYVTDEDRFHRIDSEERLTRQGFNAKFNRFQPKNEVGAPIKNAADVALDEAQLLCVTRGMYLPAAGPTFTLNGVECVNTYRPSSIPRAAVHIGPEGRQAIDLVQRHVRIICGGREHVAETLVAWMAHNVQKPGVKIRWAPLIKGVEGDGKTLFGRLAAALMGEINVKQISPKVLGTDFTDWAHGGCVGVLEEIRLAGHNRHDVFNALKPYITNDSIAVHPKGRAEFTAINTMNFLAFTNHADALPLTDTDRRWMVVFSPFSTIAGLRQAIGMETAAYFAAAYRAIGEHAGELRRWLLDFPIPAGFDPNGPAPYTDEKSDMVSLSMSPEEEVVREVIEDGAEGVTRNVLASTCLVQAARLSDPDLQLNTNALNRLLVRLGWRKVCRIKWNGQPHRIWVKGEVPNPDGMNEFLRVTLDASLSFSAKGTESAAALFDSVPDSVPVLSPL